MTLVNDAAARYQAVKSRDRRFDGVFYTAVRTTGIYCRPSCPARTPSPANVTFYPTAAAAQTAGYRACKRCLPDATPGSPNWDVAADAAGRAMRLIADGVVEREGVDGLAKRIGYTPRHLTRLLNDQLGAGPLALARAKRAQTARVLIETTGMRLTDVASASGFTSVRQFNDTMREVYAATPSDLRGRGSAASGRPDRIRLRVAVRTPFEGTWIRQFLGKRTISGIEEIDGNVYSRTVALPSGPGIIRVELIDLPDRGSTGQVPVTVELADIRDVAAAMERTRRLLDADCDPLAVAEHFADDPTLGTMFRNHPGRRVPGHFDGNEIAVRAVFGQQITVRAASTAAAALVQQIGTPLDNPVGALTHLFPSPTQVAAIDPELLKMPKGRAKALIGLCAALADGSIALDRGADRALVRARLLDLPGIGPWTADYIAMRALGDPDILLPGDIGTRDGLRVLGADPSQVDVLGQQWRPWRSYAQIQLWASLYPQPGKGA